MVRDEVWERGYSTYVMKRINQIYDNVKKDNAVR